MLELGTEDSQKFTTLSAEIASFLDNLSSFPLPEWSLVKFL